MKNTLRTLRHLQGTFLFLALVFIAHHSYAQQSNVPLNYDWIQQSEADMVKNKGFHLDQALMKYDADTALTAYSGNSSDTSKLTFLSADYPLQTSMRPWIEQGHPLRKNVVEQNCFHSPNQMTYRDAWDPPKFPNWFRRYHASNSLLQVERELQNDEPVFRLYVDPLLNLTYMNPKNDTSQDKFYINTRGVTAYGDIGTKVSFETSFWENQAFMPAYISDFANSSLVIPGQGRWKTFKKTGYDYAMASGFLSYSPCQYFNVQVGTGKHFIGDGYRSLLLSDNAFNYPFARLTGWFGPNKMFQYTTIYASLMNLVSNAPTPPGTERLYQKKAASFYQLAMKVGRVGEISLFQGLIWKAADDRNKQCIRLAYVNPVMFTSIPAYGMSDDDNYLIGGTYRFDIAKTVRIYGQWMADDLGKKGTVHHKTGMQIGVKYFDAFTVKHLHLSFEMNRVNPYSYSATDTAQAYSHYAQPLAHPLGANFSEMIFGLHYKIGDVFLNFRYEMAKLGTDSAASNYGQNIFKTDYFGYYPANSDPYKIGQGMKTTISYMDVNLGYMISYASNLNISAGYTVRNLEIGATSSPTSYVYLAVRTSLTNNYFDFFRN